jgi:hypothetical protein
MTERIPVPAVPNLPRPKDQFDKLYLNQLTNVLRLYFNLLGETEFKLAEAIYNLQVGGGGSIISLPYIAASDSTSQYATGNNTPTKVAWDSADSINGWTLDPSGFASPNYAGVYNIAYSLQLANTDNVIHDANVWLRVNGVDLAGSASKFTLQARKSAGVYNYVVAYSSVVFEAAIGDEIELWWATDLAATSGGASGIYIQYEAAQTSPFAHPSVPSAIGSITFVSALP